MKLALALLIFLGGLSVGFLLPGDSPRPPAPEKSIPLTFLGEISGERFLFAEVIAQNYGVKVIPFDPSSDDHLALREVILTSAHEVREIMNQEDAPIRQAGRINEASSHFELALRDRIDAHRNFTCRFPQTAAGKTQRSGYPDLRIAHLPSGLIAYLDPKLFRDRAITSSFRSFYFEPSPENTKVREDAIHFLLGFPHDGATSQWTFAQPKLIDLSRLNTKLKAEFSASNRDVYQLPDLAADN